MKMIVFDWNGTLLEDTSAVLEAFNVAFVQHDFRRVSLDVFQRCYEPPYEKFFSNLGIPDQRIPAVKAALVNSFHDVYGPMAAQCPLREGAGALIEKARCDGITPVILSNHLTGAIYDQLQRFGLAGYFGQEAVLANKDRAEQMKGVPKGVRLQAAFKHYGIAPSEAAIIGDTPEEAEIGKAYGMTSIGILGGCSSAERLQIADYIIRELPELPRVCWCGAGAVQLQSRP